MGREGARACARVCVTSTQAMPGSCDASTVKKVSGLGSTVRLWVAGWQGGKVARWQGGRVAGALNAPVFLLG